MGLKFFSHPAPAAIKKTIWPFFLPHHGCRRQCIYCDQTLQTAESHRPLAELFEIFQTSLESAVKVRRPGFEVAFFGGTFADLPEPWPEQFIRAAMLHRPSGAIDRIRCSTSPEGLTRERLHALKTLGLDVVELGIQTFSDDSLKQSGRGYTGEQALAACRAVKDSGLSLVIQLLPGLPGHGLKDWRRDVTLTSNLEPEAVRIYPCLVVQGTPLESLWRRGEYRPWSLNPTIFALEEALTQLWARGIPVIRIGLAPEPKLLQSLAAGPWHPAMGSMARSRTLHRYIRYHMASLPRPATGLLCPKRHLAEVHGYKREGQIKLERLGLKKQNIRPWDYDRFALTY